MKTCKKCNLEKNLDEFYSHKGHKFGVSSHCKECIKSYWHDPKTKEKRKIYRKNPDVLEREKNHHRRYRSEALKSWECYIPIKQNCEICKKELFYNGNNPKSSIAFDHRIENCAIKVSPYDWLARHIFNEKHKKIWDSCNFGILCRRCNCAIPTKNRKEWLMKLTRYISQ